MPTWTKLVRVTCIPEFLVFLVCVFLCIVIGYSIINVFVEVETVSQQLLAFIEVWILNYERVRPLNV